MSEQPRWQQLVVGVQSRANPTLRAAVDRQDVAAAIALLQTLRTSTLRATEAPTRRLLHLFNLPAASDMNRVLVQIASLEREVRELRKEAADRAEGTVDGPFP
jgi:hypothetical protein